MPDSIATQRAKIATFRNAGNFPALYRYIATQVQDQTVKTWLRSAALINTPGPANQNVLKLWVWKMNNKAREKVGLTPVTDAQNQNISDSLALSVATLYEQQLDNPAVKTFTAQAIFERDVQAAVTNLNIPAHLWAGGLLGRVDNVDSQIS
jgi:hypothetical protein